MDGAMVYALLAGAATTLIGLVLARATLHKLTGFETFRSNLADYRLLPQRWSLPAAALLVFAEAAALALLLLLPVTRAAGALAAALLFQLYAVAMAANLLRGRNRIDCGCGGSGQSISWFLVARNLCLVGGCVLAAAGSGVLPTAGAVAALAAGVLLWLLLSLYDQLLGNYSHADATGYTGMHH